MRTIPFLLALTALVTGPCLTAEEGGKPDGEHAKHEHGKPGDREEHGKKLKEFDTDGDGKLSETEKAAARAAFFEKLKKDHPEAAKKADANGDGVLSEEEAKAAREKMRERREEMKKKADTNGDGKVDEAEREAAKEKMKEHHEKKGEGKKKD